MVDETREYVSNGKGIARMLVDQGVTHVFGIPDGHTLELYDGFLETSDVDHLLVNDERTAAFAADAYARVTGHLGACDAGAAGAMNFPVALAEALGSSSPVLAITGIVKQRDMLLNIPHDINVLGVLQAVTKWAGMPITGEQVPRFFHHAIRQAINGRQGPVAVIVPEDLFYHDKNLS
ncbi:thiamine pyrophosphate-binding protein, partial [Candidatus Bathyarchaeota archaeon]|nr:thiamine pyrophosphate-binding protein [Candidatus Bathyarchaeota archaeon]